MIYSFLLTAASVGIALAHKPLPGAIIGIQSRCQGYLCPDWAMDVSRYDIVEYPNEPFEYVLNENLPLGPTSERWFQTYSAYSETTRSYVSVAADYPIVGVDSLWMHTINDYANATTPIFTNILIGHPDSAPNAPGTMTMVNVLFGPNERLFALFNDGAMYDVDISGQKYTPFGSLYEKVGFANPSMTRAHVVDGNILKSFISDTSGNDYLVKVDLSKSPVEVSVPLKLTYIKGMSEVTPIAAHMTSTNDEMEPRLTVVLAGNFDQFNYCDEETGEIIDMLSNMYEESTAILECHDSTKDCDFWRTSAYDKVNHKLYIQTHTVDGNDVHTTTMSQIGWTQNKVSLKWYPYMTDAIWPMNFGYQGYQYVTIKQD